VVGPAFFDEGDEEGAGFFVGFEVEGFEGSGVGVGLDCGGGGEDEDLGGSRDLWSFGRNAGVLRFAQNDTAFFALNIAFFAFRKGCEGGLGAGFDYAYDGDW